jgi:hypothetical protein
MSWLVVASVFGSDPSVSLYVFAKDFLPGMLLLLAVLGFYRNLEDVESTAKWLWFGSLLACAVALYEWRANENPFFQFLASDADALVDLGWIVSHRLRGGAYRASGPFAHPLTFGECIGMVVPIAIMIAIIAQRRLVRVLALSSLPLLLVCAYLTHARSSLIALTVGLIAASALVGWRAARQRNRPGYAMLGWCVLLGVLVGSVFAAGIGANMAKGRTAEEVGSSSARVTMLERGFTLVTEQPIQGFGLSTAAEMIGRMPGHSALTIDSFFLSLAMESGFVGLSLFLAAILVLVARLVLQSRSGCEVASGYGRRNLEGVCKEFWVVVAVVAALAASSVAKVALSLNHNLTLFFWFVGVAGVLLSNQREPASPIKHSAESIRPDVNEIQVGSR